MQVPDKRALAIIGCLLLVVLFGPSIGDRRSELQREFDKWLSTAQPKFADYVNDDDEIDDKSKEQAVAEIPALKLSFRETPEAPFVQYELIPSGDPQRDGQILRILELVKEANLFSLSASPLPEADGAVAVLTVKRKDGEISGAISDKEVEESIRAQLLLRLFAEYAANNAAPKTLSAHAGSDGSNS
ncbi:MAG: hypothetical protein DCC75_03505 [Proteobacteria bacterium]|nr:MAG: hypothetical protein DCC75_03505 [Pseudomonadota bacterium]